MSRIRNEKRPKHNEKLRKYGRRTNKKPPIRPFKRINRVNKDFFRNFSRNFRVLKDWFLAVSQGPGGFRKVREAYRIHFHLSWYLSDSLVKSSDQKPWGNVFFSTMWSRNTLCAIPQGRGGFRKLQGPGRIHFHLSWYLSDSVVPSYGQKQCFSSIYGILSLRRPENVA